MLLKILSITFLSHFLDKSSYFSYSRHAFSGLGIYVLSYVSVDFIKIQNIHDKDYENIQT